MNQHQGPMMFPMMFPMMSQGQEHRDHPPARVRLALEFLQHLSFKTMSRCAVNDISIEEIPGQKLTEHERSAEVYACRALGSYFQGNLTPDVYERERSVQVPGQPGIYIRCPVCPPSGSNPGCNFCKGNGHVVIYPAVGDMPEVEINTEPQKKEGE